MVTVGSRELKNRLGKYLGLVRKGQTLEITDRGKRVGLLVPAEDSGDSEHAKLLARLHAKPGIRWGSGRLTTNFKPAKLKPGKTLSEMILEDRR